MNTAILDKLWSVPAAQPYKLMRAIAVVLSGVGLLTLSAKTSVPFYPVPMTLQTLAILLICSAVNLQLGLATMVSYLVVGALGLPVFAGTPQLGIGLAYMIGPTGGYLLGFVAATLLLGYGVKLGYHKRFFSCLLIMLLSIILIYFCGYLWLGTLIGYKSAWSAGVLPFILGDTLKALLASLSLRILYHFGG